MPGEACERRHEIENELVSVVAEHSSVSLRFWNEYRVLERSQNQKQNSH
jgi:hypothetical protein